MTLKRIDNKNNLHLQRMQHNYDPRKVDSLEEKHRRLHNQLLDALESYGIAFQDRDDAVNLACHYLKTNS